MTKNISRSVREHGHPAGALFSSPSMVALLELFFLHPEEEFYQRQLESLTGKPLLSIQRELKRLERAGLVEDFREVARYFDHCRTKRHNVDYAARARSVRGKSKSSFGKRLYSGRGS